MSAACPGAGVVRRPNSLNFSKLNEKLAGNVTASVIGVVITDTGAVADVAHGVAVLEVPPIPVN